MPSNDRPLYAVLIDADNIPAKYAEPILTEIASFGEPALRRVYGDWSSGRLTSWTKEVRDLGLVAQQETANTTGKNASDIGMVIDAMDILHSGRFDGFVLVSSDSDFTALANRVREQGLDVIGIGEGKTPESLRKVCNRFILIENIVDTGRDAGGGRPAGGKLPVAEAERLVLTALDTIESADGWMTLGQLGQAVQAEHRDFDTRSYGKRKLSDLVAEFKRVETRKDGNQLFIRRID